MTAPQAGVLRLCSALAMPAWHFDAGSLLIIAENDSARRAQAGSRDRRGAPLARLLRRVLVLGDGPGWNWLGACALRQGCSADTSPDESGGWFRDQSLGWRPVTVAVMAGEATAGSAASGVLVIQRRRVADPGALRELVGAIAHDLNNIVAPIAGFAELATELPVASREPLHAYLAEIGAGAARLRAIAAELGTFAMPSKRAMDRFSVGDWVDDLGATVTADFGDEAAGVGPLTRICGSLSAANAALAAAVRACRTRGARGALRLGTGSVAGQRQRCQGCGSPLPQRSIEVIVPADGTDRSVAMRAALVLIHEAGGHVRAHSHPAASGFLLPVAAPS